MEGNIPVGGFIVFWVLQETSRNLIKAAFDAAGLSTYAPEKRTNYAALMSALKHYFNEKADNETDVKYLPRGTADENAIEVITETKGSPHNSYGHYETYAWDQRSGELMECLYQTSISILYKHEQDVLNASSVTASLVKIVGKLGGVALIPDGRVYWLPESAAAQWDVVVNAVECSACVGNRNRCHALKLVYNERMTRAVVDALVHEIDQDCAVMEREMAVEGEDALGARALRSRQEKADALREKIGRYENALNVGIENLRPKLDSVEMRAATLILKAAGAEQRESGGVDPMAGAAN